MAKRLTREEKFSNPEWFGPLRSYNDPCELAVTSWMRVCYAEDEADRSEEQARFFRELAGAMGHHADQWTWSVDAHPVENHPIGAVAVTYQLCSFAPSPPDMSAQWLEGMFKKIKIPELLACCPVFGFHCAELEMGRSVRMAQCEDTRLALRMLAADCERLAGMFEIGARNLQSQLPAPKAGVGRTSFAEYDALAQAIKGPPPLNKQQLARRMAVRMAVNGTINGWRPYSVCGPHCERKVNPLCLSAGCHRATQSSQHIWDFNRESEAEVKAYEQWRKGVEDLAVVFDKAIKIATDPNRKARGVPH